MHLYRENVFDFAEVQILMRAAKIKSHSIDIARNRLVLLILVILMAGAASTAMALSSRAGTRRGSDIQRSINDIDMPEPYYMSIQLREGDTLQSIAGTYNRGGYYSDAEYMEAVKRVNQISHDNVHPGCYLVVIGFRNNLL